MRRLHSPAIYSLMISTTIAFATPALAADQNTYRAGTPYLKTIATHYGQCENQCAGDAQCRSWNFIRPNAGAASGICEFNARSSSPVQSPVSMSGTMNARFDPALSRAVAGGTNTIRIGTPPMAVPKTVTRQQGRTTVVRQPVPQQINTQKASHKKPVNIKPVAQASKNKPRVYGTLVQPTTPTRQEQAPRQQPRIAPPAKPKMTDEQAYYRQQYLEQKRRQEAQRLQYQQRSQNRAAQNIRPITNPRSLEPAPQYIPPQPQQNMQTRPLYGSLHDDLTRSMTIVPRPITAPDNPNNADAPLATSRAVPVQPITTNRLQAPNLVGG